MDAYSFNYKVENVFALFTINVTTKTFGELVIDLNEFRDLPECRSIREIQYRVLVQPTKSSQAKTLTLNKAVKTDLLKGTKELKNHQLKLIELDSVAKDRI